jgi:antitoxin component YwqK of YwqJK toxin-antitoxin module
MAGKTLWCESKDKLRSQWVEWHKGATTLRQSCSYRNGKPEGSFTAWHPEGKPWVQGQFSGGQKVGKWKQWDSSGNEVAEGDYASGRLVAGAPVAAMADCEKVVGPGHL